MLTIGQGLGNFNCDVNKNMGHLKALVNKGFGEVTTAITAIHRDLMADIEKSSPPELGGVGRTSKVFGGI